MAEKKVIGGLSWVKGEINATLRPVRDLAILYGAANGPSDATEALAALEQVQGVLLALDLAVAAHLVDELHQMTARLAKGQLHQAREASATLTQGLLLLSDHLDQLDQGQDISPLALWPMINELRTARGDTPLTQTELLAIAAFPNTVDLQRHPQQLGRFAQAIHHGRAQYHRLLLDWYRRAPEGQASEHLGELFGRLAALFPDNVLGDVFALAQLFANAIQRRYLPITPGARTLMGRLDWILKPLEQQPPQWPQGNVFALIDLLLHTLAPLDPAPEMLTRLRTRYVAPESAEGPSAQLVERARDLLQGFAELESALDRFARGNRDDRTPLEDLEAQLRHAMDQLDLSDGADLVARLRRLIGELGTLGLVDGDELRIEAVATEMLAIKAHLQALAERRAPTAADAEVPGIDLGELTAATLRETGYELVAVREAIARFHADRTSAEALGPVPDSLLNVAGALLVLNDEAAAELAALASSLVRARYLEQRLIPGEEEFDQLANAVAALELHISQRQEGLGLGLNLLDQAREALQRLGTGAAQPVPETPSRSPAAALPELSLELIEPVAALPVEREPERAFAEPEPMPDRADDRAPSERDASDSFSLELPSLDLPPLDLPGSATIAADDSSPATAPEAPSSRDSAPLAEISAFAPLELPPLEALPEPSAAPGASPLDSQALVPEPPVSASPPAALMDPEFLEIFLEEAREVLEAAEAAFARWSNSPEDSEALGQLRRAFHTLKGSGRLVGAGQVGELAWRVEDLLNQRIEGRLGQSAALLDFVSEALKALPEVIDCDSSGRPWPIERFIADAEAIARGEEPAPALIAETSASVSAQTAPELAPAAPPEPLPEPLAAIDPDSLLAEDSELLDIFRGEAGEHLARLRAWLAESGPGQVVDEPLVRALHTLAGSGRMAGIDSIAGLAKALERRFEALREAGALLPPEERERLAQALEALEARLVELPETGAAAPRLMALTRELESAPAPRHITASATATPPRGPQASQEQPPAAPAPSVGLPAPEEPAPAPQAARAGLDPELVELFLEDARELLDQLDTLVGAWQAEPEHLEPIDAINRALHTLKGSARLAGLTPIGDLAHALESRLKILHEAPEEIDAAALALAQRALDALAGQVEAVASGEPLPALGTLLVDLGETEAAALAPPGAATSVSAPDSSAEPAAAPPSAAPLGPAQTAPDSAPQIRVRAQLLNQLVDNAGEISIYRARLSQRNNQLGFSLGELDQTLTRLRSQLRQLEVETQRQLQQRGEVPEIGSEEARAFDSLEFDRYSMLQQLSGSLAETVDDLASVKDMLGGYQREVADLLGQQARLADDLQDRLLRTRLVPFAQVVPRLQRLVRQTADSLGKSAQLEVIGPELGLDRAVLDRLVAPLEHLLRNGVDHGLEDPETRAARGKPATGTLILSLRREGNDAVISLSDDGKGMDVAAIRAKAIERGLLAPEARIPDEALLQFVLEPGFTTRTQVTQISGRGVGLDVVASEIKAANGSIDLASTPGRGATFTIRLPLTLAMIEAFLVQLGETIYAIPHSSIEAVARIAREDLLALYQGQEQGFHYLGQSYRVVYLGGVLDAHQQPQFGERRRLPLLLARLGEQRVALQVDSLIESQRILVKPLGPQLADVRWLSGGTILPDGRVALILDALALLRSSAIQEYRPRHATAAGATSVPTIMVVDDSLTVRRVTSRLLRRQGMEVMTAKDGVEALTLLDERLPDLLLLDIEMPRMDGYELTRHIRRSERLQGLPIIMITSRTGAKHREHAMALGVNRYLGKPYQESQLLDEIRLLLAEREQ